MDRQWPRHQFARADCLVASQAFAPQSAVPARRRMGTWKALKDGGMAMAKAGWLGWLSSGSGRARVSLPAAAPCNHRPWRGLQVVRLKEVPRHYVLRRSQAKQKVHLITADAKANAREECQVATDLARAPPARTSRAFQRAAARSQQQGLDLLRCPIAATLRVHP